MTDLLVVLQTHSKKSAQNKKRYTGTDKKEVMRRCVASLIDSLNYANNLNPDLIIRLKIFDDHSDEKSLELLKSLTLKCDFEVDLESLKTNGIMPSILKCYEYGRDHGRDWVYFIQDDFLFQENSIDLMLFAINQFSANTGKPASIHAFNDPYEYMMPENTALKSHIVASKDRYWRTNIHAVFSMMTHSSVIQKNWDLFEKMGRSKYSPNMETLSISKIFYEREYFQFTPIPSLALHMQYESEIDPYLNWREWWDKYEVAEFPEIDQKNKTLLHLGCGPSTIKTAGFADDLTDYKEYRFDIDSKYNPDICGDITDLSNVPDNSFDVIYTSHTVEHIDFYKVVPTLKQFIRVLKPEGFVRIVVPDLKSLSNKISEGDLLGMLYNSSGGPVNTLDMLYGQAATVLRHGDFMRHKTGFTKRSFTEILNDAGLNKFEIVEDEFNLIVNIFK